MKIYVVVKTAREDIEEFPGYFGKDPRKPEICLVDSYTGDACTLDRATAEEAARLQTEEYGEYFNYTVREVKEL